MQHIGVPLPHRFLAPAPANAPNIAGFGTHPIPAGPIDAVALGWPQDGNPPPPFPITLLPNVPNDYYRFRHPPRASFYTDPASHTDTASSVQESLRALPEGLEIRQSVTFWPNLLAWSHPATGGINGNHTLNYWDGLAGNEHLYMLAEPGNLQVQRAACRLAARALESRYTNDQDLEVNGEPSMQVQIQKQILSVVQDMLYLRYRTMNDDANGRYHPRWNNTIEAAHMRQDLGNRKAGHSDFTLTQGRGRGWNLVAGEVKTDWSYPTAELNHIFTDIICPGGVLDEEGVTLSHKIVKQIWGEMDQYQVNFAFWTNGHSVVVVAKTAPNQLTFSPAINAGRDDVIWGIYGLSLAAVDAQRRLPEGIPPTFVMDTIVPIADRLALWAQ